jgi:hypothetical protein
MMMKNTSRLTTTLLLCLGALSASQGCEEMVNRSALENQELTARSTWGLQDGMGILEAEAELGALGLTEATGRRNAQKQDALDWPIEWRIGRVYEIQGEKVLAIYSASTPENTDVQPPDSAWRLVHWAPMRSATKSPIALWANNS